jgi:predicted AlkP superfamily pyrophosphatase or phosphodiesterase
VDHAGHEFGPDDQHTTDAVASVDAAIGRLIAGLRSRQVNANIVVVSDHGMAATSAERVVYLNKILPPDSFKVVTAGTYAGIEVAPGQDAL